MIPCKMTDFCAQTAVRACLFSECPIFSPAIFDAGIHSAALWRDGWAPQVFGPGIVGVFGVIAVRWRAPCGADFAVEIGINSLCAPHGCRGRHGG